MQRKVKWVVGIVVVSVCFFAFKKPAENYFEIAKSLDIFATLFKEVNTYYVDEVDPQKLIRHGIDSMLESLDPYTDFIPEEDLDNFRIATTGQYAGIGALIGVINKKIVITHPYKNFPANKSGIKVGDELIAVNGVSVQGKTTAETSALLKGPSKTEVEVRIRRYGQKNDLIFKIKREKISINNLAYAGLIGTDIGYLKLDDFTPGASREVADAITKLKQQGAKKIILDLRDNPGGLLHEAVNIVNLFIPKGKEVVSTKGKVAEWNKTYTTLNNPLDTEIPLAILISEGSASAAEIVAGALQDYDRAILIGGRTFGKGLVQTTRQLSYNAQLKVTTAKYYIPSGRCIQKLDYAHRKLDGSVSAFADSLKSAFQTKRGRTVYDGGGLDPDILLEQRYLGEVTSTLFTSGLIFEYATKFCNETPVQPDLKTFKLSDREFDKFITWTRDQKFTYATSLEYETKKLMEAAKKERYFSDLEGELKSLSNKIESNKATDLARFKDEIVELLSRQIAFHYALNEGQYLVALNHDKAIEEAKKLFEDSLAYKKILSIN
ncbi:MAG: S41 family peptidase [Cyclobacteriaceae bacterium]|nr:S41 family peptidase [Cyclobacteriaceae bacterium]UYN87301.1 MAG: S41 family peptidase [Cyclobacteriaceae bacterium]